MRTRWLKWRNYLLYLNPLDLGCPLPNDVKTVISVLQNLNKLKTFKDCVELARNKFEKYFVHKSATLTKNFPQHSLATNGEPFWSYPKRCPKQVKFDPCNDTHFGFVKEVAIVWASFVNIKVNSSKSLLCHCWLASGELSKAMSKTIKDRSL